MPLFEYVCRSCGKQFEELVFGGAQPGCPACDAKDPEKVLSAHAVGRSELPAGCGRCGDPRGPGACMRS